MYCVFHSVYCIELFIPCQPWVFIFVKIFCQFTLLFSSNTVWVVAQCDSFAVAFGTVLVDHPRLEKGHYLVFTRFVIGTRTLCVDHSSLLGYIYNALAQQWVYIKGKKAHRSGLGGFCYEVFPTLGCRYQAANANCSSFAVTFFASSARFPQP